MQRNHLEDSADDDSDPGKIKFEQSPCAYASTSESRPISNKNTGKKRVKKRIDSSSESPEAGSTNGVSANESDTSQPRKRRRLIRGRRTGSILNEDADEDEDDSLLGEVDENNIVEARLRTRSKKSAFAQNLERLQRRRRGQDVNSENENDEDASDSETSASHETPEYFEGARPTELFEISHEKLIVNESDDDGFIVEDDSDQEKIPELPAMFSMGTFQDLSHHFKVICQLFVHVAVQQPGQRANYFSVPFAVVRRKLLGLRDSWVASSIWKPNFRKPLETYPAFHLEQLDFAVPLCDACNLGKRVATLRGVLGGLEYNKLTYEPLRESDSTVEHIDWNLGRFCAARAKVFHEFTHWEHILYHDLRIEIDTLRNASEANQTSSTDRRVFIPVTKGPAPPSDLTDADGIMDWLDGRGVINAEWIKIKDMMEHAQKLEGKGMEEDIELG
ncbi:hypothetical protein BU17DRAFT_44843 [Hysterangium stoloniferum]|nr:hypothetical protein BU17DRAFT_44843 [Hysterangium stoloniferum]